MRSLGIRFGGLLSLAVSAVLAVPQAALAATPVVADLEGRPLSIDRVARYYCHDLDYPRIHCFSTAAELEATFGGGESAGTSVGVGESVVDGEAAPIVIAAAPSGTWVTVYQDGGWTGSYAYLSRSYSNLGDIGWNDKISSYRVHMSFGGEFWQHIQATGWLFPWTPYQTKSYVGDQFNDQFSSFYRT